MTSRDPLTHQVMKRTGHAHFNRVALHGVFTSLQLQKLGARRGARPAGGKPCPEDVGDFDQFGLGTDGAGLARSASNVAPGAKEFRVSIADVFVAQDPGCEFGQQRVADETELNDRSISSARTESLIHYRRLYPPEFD